MAIDFFAMASNGYFPTPTPAAAARMSFAGTWGCFGGAPILDLIKKGLGRLGLCLTIT